MTQGFWVLVGLLVFLLLEKMFPDQDNPEEDAATASDLNFNSAVGISNSCSSSSCNCYDCQ